METVINVVNIIGCAAGCFLLIPIIKHSWDSKNKYHRMFQWMFVIMLLYNALSSAKFMTEKVYWNSFIWVAAIFYYLHKRYEKGNVA